MGRLFFHSVATKWRPPVFRTQKKIAWIEIVSENRNSVLERNSKPPAVSRENELRDEIYGRDSIRDFDRRSIEQI